MKYFRKDSLLLIVVGFCSASFNFSFEFVYVLNTYLTFSGIFFNSQLTIPDDCKGESLCEIVREKMKPGTKLYLEGDFSSTGFELRAGYNGNGLTFGKDLILQDVKLVVSVGTSTEFYVQGEVRMKQPPVVFRGRLFQFTKIMFSEKPYKNEYIYIIYRRKFNFSAKVLVHL